MLVEVGRTPGASLGRQLIDVLGAVEAARSFLPGPNFRRPENRQPGEFPAAGFRFPRNQGW
jgi:hypothetical protein